MYAIPYDFLTNWVSRCPGRKYVIEHTPRGYPHPHADISITVAWSYYSYYYVRTVSFTEIVLKERDVTTKKHVSDILKQVVAEIEYEAMKAD